MPVLLRRAHEAIPAILAEQRLDAADVDVTAELAADRFGAGTSSALGLDADSRSPAVSTVVLTA